MTMQNTIAVCLVTYNQEQYIAQAIESVLMQKVNATVRLFIGEDCSTDNTRAICQTYQNQYPDTIRLIEREKNMGLVRNTLDLLNRIYIDSQIVMGGVNIILRCLMAMIIGLTHRNCRNN